MSSSVSYQSAVEEARYEAAMKATRDRAELERARAEMDALIREVAALAESGLEADEVAPVRRSVSTMDDATAARAIREHTARERVRIISGATRLKLKLSGDTQVTSVSEALARANSDGETAGEQPVEGEDEDQEITSRVERRLARLRADALPTRQMESLLATARNPEAGAGRRRTAADGLSAEVKAANDRARDREVARGILSRAAGALAGINTPKALEVRARLDDPDPGPAGARLLLSEAEAIQAESRKDWEEDYVSESLADVFEELGYELEEGFETNLTSDDLGRADVEAKQWPGYAIRAMRTFNGGISLEVVRGKAWRGDQSVRDDEVERAWCDELPAVEEAMREKGVELEQGYLRGPGEAEVKVDPAIKVETENRPKRAKPKERRR